MLRGLCETREIRADRAVEHAACLPPAAAQSRAGHGGVGVTESWIVFFPHRAGAAESKTTRRCRDRPTLPTGPANAGYFARYAVTIVSQRSERCVVWPEPSVSPMTKSPPSPAAMLPVPVPPDWRL